MTRQTASSYEHDNGRFPVKAFLRYCTSMKVLALPESLSDAWHEIRFSPVYVSGAGRVLRTCGPKKIKSNPFRRSIRLVLR